jgi:hypothetical protein
MSEDASKLRRRLKRLGLSQGAVDAAWPEWWSDSADASLSATAELRFSLSRKLGLDPRSLLEEDSQPRFVWHDAARFKNLRGESEIEKAAITSFGAALGNVLFGASPSFTSIVGTTASSLRSAILARRPFVRLIDLLSLCWACGVPIVHLRIFPWPNKRMAAMTVRVGNRYALLLGKDSLYPAHIAFYIAHEIGHIALGHIAMGHALIDLERDNLADAGADSEEASADSFALELLTGNASPQVLSLDGRADARSLASRSLQVADELRIEPGTMALCFGYSTGNWAVANGAMRFIYSSAKPVWKEVNDVAWSQLSTEGISDDTKPYLKSVLGRVRAR